MRGKKKERNLEGIHFERIKGEGRDSKEIAILILTIASGAMTVLLCVLVAEVCCGYM